MPHATKAPSSVVRYAVTFFVTAAFTWSLSSFVNSCRGDTSIQDLAAATKSTESLMQSFTSKTPSSKIASNSPSRVWNIFKGGFPCYHGQVKLMDLSPAHRGFLFQRPMKVGSTTMVGVVLRLAHNRSPWMKKDIKCLHRSMHGSALEMEYDKRDRSKSFLLSLVRHPTKRVVSEFFHFRVAIHNVEPTDVNFKAYVASPKLQHKYINDLRVDRYVDDRATNETLLRDFLESKGLSSRREFVHIVRRGDERGRRLGRLRSEFMDFGTNDVNMTQIVQDILDGYDFIGVTERMDESLVAMQMLLNLTTKDILYTHSRGSGTFSNGPVGRPCIYITPSFVTPGMKEYFASDEWQTAIRGDLMLYEAAHASLDRTIAALGEKEFQENLQALKEGLKLAESNCKGRVKTLCSGGGDAIPFENNTCYVWGEACDHECIGELEL